MADWFSGIEQALGSAVAGAVQSQSAWAALKAHATAGTLRMEPGVADACAKACQVAYDDLAEDVNVIRQASRVDGLGSWPSGIALATKFGEKADGAANGNSAVGALQAHRDVLLQMRDTFTAAGKAYAATEQATVDILRGSA